jgi:hypothetical protein
MNQSNNFFGQHLFSQLSRLCSRSILNPVFQESKANRYYKKLKCYEHLMAMLYGVLSGCTTLGEMEAGLVVAEGKLLRLHRFNYIALPDFLQFMSKIDTNDEKNPQHPTYSVHPDTVLFDFPFG